MVSGTFLSFHDNHFTDCPLEELWDLPDADANFIIDVSLLDEAAQYPSCVAGSVGSAVLMNTTLNTATVAYYTGTTPGSRACFVCNESGQYGLNAAINERFCLINGTWSGDAIICGMYKILASFSGLSCSK